ncbi:MAG: hypothetical protein ACXVHQ_35435 [Solirubrobacteraceae bacterium]
MLNAPGRDSESLELLFLDLLAEGDSPAEAAATLVDRDVAGGSYAEGSRELETAFEHYRDQAERVLSRAQQTAEGLFRVNTVGGREHRPSADAINLSHFLSLGLHELTRIAEDLEAAVSEAFRMANHGKNIVLGGVRFGDRGLSHGIRRRPR